MIRNGLSCVYRPEGRERYARVASSAGPAFRPMMLH